MPAKFGRRPFPRPLVYRMREQTTDRQTERWHNLHVVDGGNQSWTIMYTVHIRHSTFLTLWLTNWWLLKMIKPDRRTDRRTDRETAVIGPRQWVQQPRPGQDWDSNWVIFKTKIKAVKLLSWGTTVSRLQSEMVWNPFWRKLNWRHEYVSSTSGRWRH